MEQWFNSHPKYHQKKSDSISVYKCSGLLKNLLFQLTAIWLVLFCVITYITLLCKFLVDLQLWQVFVVVKVALFCREMSKLWCKMYAYYCAVTVICTIHIGHIFLYYVHTKCSDIIKSYIWNFLVNVQLLCLFCVTCKTSDKSSEAERKLFYLIVEYLQREYIKTNYIKLWSLVFFSIVIFYFFHKCPPKFGCITFNPETIQNITICHLSVYLVIWSNVAPSIEWKRRHFCAYRQRHLAGNDNDMLNGVPRGVWGIFNDDYILYITVRVIKVIFAHQ